MNISSDLLSSTIASTTSAPVTPPPRPEGENISPVSQVPAMEKSSNSLSDDERGAVMSAARDLENSGADVGEVKAFVDNKLESYGVEPPPGGQRSGQMVDVYV